MSLNKKVLLRERKRHTARCALSTPYVVLPGYPSQQGTPPSWPGGGYLTRVPPLSWPGWGVPDQGTPARVPPPSWPGQGGTLTRVPPCRVPWLDLAGYPPPPGWTWQGTPPPAGPGRGTAPPPPRCVPHGILGGSKQNFHRTNNFRM